MWRRLFNIATIASLLLCLLSGALWARSLGHYERSHLHYHRWPATDEVHSYYLGIIWYQGGRLRVRANCRTLSAAYFDSHPREVLKLARAQYTPGWKCSFLDRQSHPWGEPEFPFLEIFHWRHSWRVDDGHQWQLSVRLWLPTLLFGVLPALWIYRWRRSKEHPWQFSMRELFATFTSLAVLLGLAIRLAN